MMNTVSSNWIALSNNLVICMHNNKPEFEMTMDGKLKLMLSFKENMANGG